MLAHICCSRQELIEKVGGVTAVTQVLERIAAGTATENLVVVVYLVPDSDVWAGEYCGTEIGCSKLCRGRGAWAVARKFPPPVALPSEYQLIRMVFGMRVRFPHTAHDTYGWESRCNSFADHVAHVFAHELYHYRCNHLGLARDGEIAACKWSDQRVRAAGYSVMSKRVERRKHQKQKVLPALPSGVTDAEIDRLHNMLPKMALPQLRALQTETALQIAQREHQEREIAKAELRTLIRRLPVGSRVRVKGGFCDELAGQVLVTLSKPKSGRRIRVRKPSGATQWLYPMDWLDPV